MITSFFISAMSLNGTIVAVILLKNDELERRHL